MDEITREVEEFAKQYGYIGLYRTAPDIQSGFEHLKSVLSNKHSEKIEIIAAYQSIINKLALSLAILHKRYTN